MDRGTFSSSSRAELIEIGRKLYEEALVRREDELITDPRGQPIGWLLDTRVPTLDGELFTEVGSVIAERLRERGARQVVGYGFGAHPLVCSVLAVSEGDEFKGGLIREERKEHGRRRLVEGPIDADQPVVMVDDIINSGRSASEALRLVRSAGFAVDGLLTLFNFTWSNGQDRIEAEGLWVDSLLDLNLQEGTGSGSDSA
ncbi:orotate phosphoribosyltransferase [Salinibacter ruber]|nr:MULTISPECIES: orotate phosphoribosyltransferase [Salinibacter]MCS3683691.1 orotate phosphoribosyltransferase [Salinibacter ruber]MCS4032480.1 orotate phosphoribosyltransferase [Salinibacter ruber]